MLPDICILTVSYAENDTLHILLSVIDGEVRSILFRVVRDEYGISTAAILDMATRNKMRHFPYNTAASPTLIYTWIALNTCSAKIRSACGIWRGMACERCGARTGKAWGLDVGGEPRCMMCVFLARVTRRS